MGQLWRALAAARSHPDRDARARAVQKAAQWDAVLSGMAGGELRIGARTPVADTPAWVTLEVVHGGFVTGRYLAEMPLDDDEIELLRSLPESPVGATDRERINLWHLSDQGLDLLYAAISGARYQVEVPEQGALLVVAWLVRNGHYAAALDLISELRPLMHRLRFTPQLGSQARARGSLVHVQSVAEVAAPLRRATVPRQIQSMRETLRVWHPLFDRLVALWSDTVDGELPQLVDGVVDGGWPCRVWPTDWSQRREQWLADYHAARANNSATTRHTRPKSNFARLRAALEASPEDGSKLTPRDVGWLRRALANTITKHGAPGSQRRAALRTMQAAIARRPTFADLAQVVAGRLDAYPADGGIPSIDPFAADVVEGESSDDRAVGVAIPDHIVRKVSRALDAPVERLVAEGVIPSGEVLARVMPQITADIVAARTDDPGLGSVYRQIYAAFRQRRSLLLLNLEHQVSFDELPWVRALAPFRTTSGDRKSAAVQALRQTALLALTAFPQSILPNPLTREMGALAAEAGLSMPLVEEVAADIFMGTFTTKWRRAAAVASEVMAGTLYARYYDLPARSAWESKPAPDVPRWRRRRQGNETADDFATLCTERAKQAQGDGKGGFVAVNGTILEQSQILTTHNLAQLTAELDLRDRIVELAAELADTSFDWLIRRLAQPWREDHATLQMIKNAAYAWRQAIFFLSFCEPDAQLRVIERVREQVPVAGPAARFGAAVDGLACVTAGGWFGADGRPEGAPGRRFLGWSVGRHWLMPSADPSDAAGAGSPSTVI